MQAKKDPRIPAKAKVLSPDEFAKLAGLKTAYVEDLIATGRLRLDQCATEIDLPTGGQEQEVRDYARSDHKTTFGGPQIKTRRQSARETAEKWLKLPVGKEHLTKIETIKATYNEVRQQPHWQTNDATKQLRSWSVLRDQETAQKQGPAFEMEPKETENEKRA